MALSAHDIAVLNAQARAVGERIGWEMHFLADTDPTFVGVTAGAHHVFVMGPARRSDLTRADVESLLNALRAGTRRLVDDNGYPHLI